MKHTTINLSEIKEDKDLNLSPEHWIEKQNEIKMDLTKQFLTSENEFSKSFKFDDEVELFVSKALDDESGGFQHYLICSVKELPDLGVANIQYPMAFKEEEDRNRVFDEFQPVAFMDQLRSMIKKQKEEAKKSDN